MKTILRPSVFTGPAPLALIALLFLMAREAVATTAQSATPAQNKACADCHAKSSPALVMEWQRSRHAEVKVGCLDCHAAETNRIGAWKHEGMWITTLVTPKDCGQCHETEVQQFSHSHHAKAGEILASLDNVLAEKVAGMPGNKADAVNGCWQCHGTIVKFKRDKRAKSSAPARKAGRSLILTPGRTAASDG